MNNLECLYPSPPPAMDYLRYYQSQAFEASMQALLEGKHPVIALPTGAGKSRVIASLCQALPGRVLVATHRKELLQQNSEELAILQEECGIYSAGLDRRETEARVIFGGIQSIYRRMEELQKAGAFEVVIVDEAHLVPPPSQSNTMYAQLFRACPEALRVGLSATPYRLNGGSIWGDEDAYFSHLVCDVSIQSLTPEYLAPLNGVLTAHEIDLTGVRTQQGEFVLSDMSQVACDDSVVDGALNELCRLGAKRKHWLVFCIDVSHTELVTRKLKERGISADYLIGETGRDGRTEVLDRFKDGELQALVGCLVFTTGFNIPFVDLVASLRPTQSKSLFVQMIGRGSRKAAGKVDCCIIDFGGNIERHAPLDDVLAACDKSPEREAQDAEKEKKRKAARERELKHGARASLLDPFSDAKSINSQRVLSISYDLEPSKKYPDCHNIVALYRLSGDPKWVKSWICLEYSGGARWHAEQWFKRRGIYCPGNAQDGLTILRSGPRPISVVLKQEGKYYRVAIEHFEETS